MPRFRLAVLLAGVVLGSFLGAFIALSAPAGADTAGDAARFLALTNQARAGQGIAPLASDGLLAGVARTWSAHLAAVDALSHNPGLASAVSGWQSLGENVGMGPSVDSIQQAFINSPEHYRNIMDGAFSRVGVAVAYNGQGTVFVTLDFEQPMAAAAAPVVYRPTPAPAARPAAAVSRPAPAPVAHPAPQAAPAPAAPAPGPVTVAAPVPAPAPAAPTVSPRLLPDAGLPPTDGLEMVPARASRSTAGHAGGQARHWAVGLAVLAVFALGVLGLSGDLTALAGRRPWRFRAAA